MLKRIIFTLTGIILLLLLPDAMLCAQEDPYRNLIDQVGQEGIYQDADIAVVFDSTDVRVEDSGLSHVVNHRLLKILTWKGAKRMTALRFNYDPASNFLQPRKVVVHRAGGTSEPVDTSAILDLFAPQRMIYWGARMQVLELPRLNVGDAVEIETYKKGFQIAYLEDELPSEDERYIPPMKGHFYDVVTFRGSYPIKVKFYRMRISRQKPAQFRVYNGEVFSSLTFDCNLLVYSFWKENLPAVKHEPRQPGVTDFVPKVVLATVKDWPERSRWFFQVNDTVFAANDDVRETAREIVRGLKSEDEQIAAVLHWTAQNIRYSGINMGKGEGYTLHPGIMTLNDRCGVCKDIAGMSITLLRALGFTVYPAMTMAGARVEMIPADQFNHCVVAVKREDGSYTMIDPTWAPYAMDVWSPAEGEQNYVIGSPEGEDRMAIRSFQPQENLTKVELTGTISNRGDLEGTITIEGTSYGDTRLRRGVAYRPAERHQSMFANWVAHIAPDAELISVKTSDIDDLSKPYRLQLRFRAPGYALLANERMLLSPAAVKLVQADPRTFDLVYEYKSEKRENPLHVWNPRQVIISESIKIPGSYLLIDKPDLPEVQSEVASCQIEVTQKSRTIKTSVNYIIAQRSIPVKYYDQVKGSYDAIKDFSQQIWQLKKGS